MAKQPSPVKKFIRGAVTTAGRIWFHPKELPPPVAPEKVVIIKLWAIGEYLMATPAFVALRARYADAEITFVTGTTVSPVAAAAPYFDKVVTFPEEAFVRRRLGPLGRLCRILAREGYDAAVVFHHAWEFTLFTAAAGIPHRIGLDRNGDGFAHTVKVPCREGIHQVEEYFELARACGAQGEPGPLTVFSQEEDNRAAERLLESVRDGARPLVLIAPGGGVNVKTRMEDKRWPAEYYSRLIKTLAPDFNCVLVGSEGDRETNARVAQATAVADLTGKTSLRVLYALMARAAAFIGNDSAPMHLAAAARIPTVAFFGPTDPHLNGPWKTKALVVTRAEKCQPCYKDGYFPRCGRRPCLTSLLPEEVAPCVREFLATGKEGESGVRYAVF